MSATFRAVVAEAFVATLRESEKPDDYPGILAHKLREILRREGFSIHRAGECVHPHGTAPEGRPMTEGELAATAEAEAALATRGGSR